MKKSFWLVKILITISVLNLVTDCKKNEPTGLPVLSTALVANITATEAESGGDVTSDGGVPITERGICYSLSHAPTTADSKIIASGTTGPFISNLTGLTTNTICYVRAYATNSIGTAYGNEISFTPVFPNCGTITDVDGNIYKTVTIGTQCWMQGNLKTTKYSDGTSIPNVTDAAAWRVLTTSAYCWYRNDGLTYKDTYGALYNWYTVDRARNVCPTGWHVPSDAEWTTLTTFLGGEISAGGKLKEAGSSHWLSVNVGATNESGFTALPAGYNDYDGVFYNINMTGAWWSSTENPSPGSTTSASDRVIGFDGNYVFRSFNLKRNGFSVRCLKD